MRCENCRGYFARLSTLGLFGVESLGALTSIVRTFPIHEVCLKYIAKTNVIPLADFSVTGKHL